jgi:spermidine synthase
MLYTKEFFKQVKRSFKSRFGMFAMHSSSPITRPVAFNCILKTLKSVFKHVSTFYAYIQMYGTLWSISVCSDASNVARFTKKSVNERLKKNGIRNSRFYTGTMHQAMLAEYPYITDIRNKAGKIITDRHPEFPDRFAQ